MIASIVLSHSFAHLSKATSDLQQKCTQLATPFWDTVFMLFQMVLFILFGVLGPETTFSLVKVLQQPIRYFHFKVFRANTRNKMDHIMWKSMKNCAKKWCRRLCAFLFEATCAFGKMCWAVVVHVRKPMIETHFFLVFRFRMSKRQAKRK